MEQVEATKIVMEKMQAQMDIMAAERDEWRDAYRGVADKRKERDLLVENLMEQLRTLESTTRDEEVRASHAHGHLSLLQKEKELLMERNRKQKAELDEAYTRLAFTTDEMQTARDEQQALERTVQQLSAWRAAKDTQVASLVQEKTRLFRLVTDLRSTIKAGPGGNAAAAAASLNGSAANADNDLSISTGSRTARRSSASSTAALPHSSSARALSSSRGSSAASLIASALSGTGERPTWSTLSGDGGESRRRRNVGPAGAPISSAERLDQLSLQGSVNSHAMVMRKQRRLAQSQSQGASNATSPSRSRTNLHASASTASLRSSSSQRQLQPQQQQQQRSDDDRDLEDAMYSPSARPLASDGQTAAVNPSSTPRRRLLLGTHSSSEDEADQSQTATVVAAKQKLVLRLKRHIELLEEKNRELEKALGLLRGDNQLLLVRFRAAHERRVVAEKKLKQTQAELEELRVTQQQQRHHYQHQQQQQQQTNGNTEFYESQQQQQQQQPPPPLEYEPAYTNTQPTSPYNPTRSSATQAAGRWK